QLAQFLGHAGDAGTARSQGAAASQRGRPPLHLLSNHPSEPRQQRRPAPVRPCLLRRPARAADGGAADPGSVDGRRARRAAERNRSCAPGQGLLMTELALVSKATVILATAWLAARLARRAPAAARALVWSCAFAALLVLPLLTWLVPPRSIALPVINERA